VTCEHSTALQGPEGVSSRTSCSDTDQLEPAKSKNTHGWYCLPDSETETFPSFLSGTTSTLLMGDRGEDELTFCAEDFLARILVAREVEPGQSMESDQCCGLSNSEWLAKWDARTCSWKTAQNSLIAGCNIFSGRLPKWGTMQDGEFGVVQMWEHVTSERGAGSLPTPRCQAVRSCNVRQENYARNGENGNLEEAVAVRYLVPMGRLPTPRSCSAMAARLDTNGQTSENRFQNLETKIAKMLPTPLARDWKDGSVSAEQAMRRMTQDLPRHIAVSLGNDNTGWFLNPAFVEEMMGWPIGWAALRPLETDRIREQQQKHSAFFRRG
jgi:hypothetical protein